MRLNHFDLHVPDVSRTASIFVGYFDFEKQFERKGLTILRDESGLELVISEPVPGFGTSDQVSLDVVTYHIGFMLDERQAVDDLFAKLATADVELRQPPKAIRGGWLFYCLAPGRILIEIGCRAPQDRLVEP